MQHAADSRQIHELLRKLRRFDDRFQTADLPCNGIYFFYEKGERVDGSDRIVRVGTHVGEDRLAKRLKLHYHGRARQSVFRRNVGNALIHAGLIEGIPSDAAPFGSDQFSPALEAAITARFAETFSFSVIRVDEVSDRLRFEAGLIALFSSEPVGQPSEQWLGHHSTIEAVRASGLWNKQHVGGTPLCIADFELLHQMI